MDGFITIVFAIALLFALIYFPWIKPLKDKGYTWKKFVEDQKMAQIRSKSDRYEDSWGYFIEFIAKAGIYIFLLCAFVLFFAFFG